MRDIRIVVAAFVGALSFPLAPIVGHASTISYAASGGRTVEPPAWAAPLYSFAEPAEVYALYGRVWIVVFAAFLAAALHLRARLAPTSRRGVAWMLAGLPLTIVGNVGDYWLGRDAIGQAFYGASFAITMIGILLYSIGAVILARGLLKSRELPRAVAIAFALAPTGILVNLLLVPNAPAAFVPPMALGWIVLALAPDDAALPTP